VRDAAGVAGLVVGRRIREEVGGPARAHAAPGAPLLVPLAVLGEDLDRRVIDGDAAGSVGLGVLLDVLARDPHVVAADVDDAVLQVDVRPAEREELGAAHARHHRDPYKRAPVVVLLPRSSHQGGRLGRRGRLRVRGWRARDAGELGRVGRDPAPPVRRGHCAADDEMNLADGRGRERLADVLLALDDLAGLLRAVVRRVAGRGRAARRALVPYLAALVRPVHPVLDERASVAA